MSLHISLSTLCPDAAALRGWHSVTSRVDFWYEGRYSSIEEHKAEIGNQFNKDAGNFLGVDSKAGRNSVFPQRDTSRGRYRRTNAVPT
ncbi:hypothetical protein H6F96_05965 [Microcoleus sp. FACHB-53]|nr:hypothetical protein [Microcoleus sp. FACHB-53]